MQYETIGKLWEDNQDAETMLVDVPIGLRETSNDPRKCDSQAREALGSPRSRSVFPTPVRAAVHCRNYERAKKTQEQLTDGSLGTQTWAICDKIRELDCFFARSEDARGIVREAHPELCFWALNESDAMAHSKTGQPLMAFWERVDVLEAVDDDALQSIRDAGQSLTETTASNDDLLDAFALAISASSLTASVDTLPDDPEDDPQNLPMEMVYSIP